MKVESPPIWWVTKRGSTWLNSDVRLALKKQSNIRLIVTNTLSYGINYDRKKLYGSIVRGLHYNFLLQYVRTFIPVHYFYPSLIFEGKARSLPLEGRHIWDSSEY
jgi:hypothetical protein